MAEFVKAAKRGEIPEGRAIAVELRGQRIALFNVGGVCYAINNACLHLGAPLSAGEIHGTRVVCPLHGWVYDFSTGANVDDPSLRLACFRVKLEGDDVFIEI